MKIPKQTPESKYLDKLRKITAALEVLVTVLPPDKFLAVFKRLHQEAVDEYYALKK